MVSYTWKALRDLELFLLQQRKRHIAIYTNSKTMQRLLVEAHPNIIVEVIKPPNSTRRWQTSNLKLK